MPLSDVQIAEFRTGVLRQYEVEGRDFPWRRTQDPWPILVSEVMLQQTRTETVVGKWEDWVRRFPGPAALASCSLSEVLTLWKGLGYNRRALALRRAAAIIVEKYDGAVPRDKKDLESLPGVGPYTAGAVRAFAFGIPEVFIETNIRAVFLFYFFPGTQGVKDKDIEPYVAATLMKEDPRSWYYALMDYGAVLKRTVPNPGRRSAAYILQSRFKGSHRQIRAAVLHALALRGPMNEAALEGRVSATLAEDAAEGESPAAPPAAPVEFGEGSLRKEDLRKAVEELEREGFLELCNGTIRLNR